MNQRDDPIANLAPGEDYVGPSGEIYSRTDTDHCEPGSTLLVEYDDEDAPRCVTCEEFVPRFDAVPASEIGRIEVLHERDPDGGCDVTVFIDGHRVPVDVVEDVDPGRGHDRHDWDLTTIAVAGNREYTEAFREAVVEARELATDSEYIEN